MNVEFLLQNILQHISGYLAQLNEYETAPNCSENQSKAILGSDQANSVKFR
jgi:hypothetical protein